MLKCDFIKITLVRGCSPVSLLHIFRTHFPKNTSGVLFLPNLRGVLRTQSKIQNDNFCKNSYQLKAVDYFRKRFHLKYASAFGY